MDNVDLMRDGDGDDDLQIPSGARLIANCNATVAAGELAVRELFGGNWPLYLCA